MEFLRWIVYKIIKNIRQWYDENGESEACISKLESDFQENDIIVNVFVRVGINRVTERVK